jgi:hypothetical protein
MLNLSNLYMLGAGGNVTATGYFVDTYGNQLGVSFSGTILQGNGSNSPQSLAGLYGQATPAGAAGVWLVLSGNIRWMVGTSSTDFKTNYANYPLSIAGPDYNTFGKVAM